MSRLSSGWDPDEDDWDEDDDEFEDIGGDDNTDNLKEGFDDDSEDDGCINKADDPELEGDSAIPSGPVGPS